MATKLSTTVEAFRRTPIFDVPSNQLYLRHDSGHPDAASEVAALEGAKQRFLEPGSTLRMPELDYPRLDADEMNGYRSILLGLLEDIDDAPDTVASEQLDAMYDAVMVKLEEVNRHLTIARLVGGAASTAAEWLSDLSDDELRQHAAVQGLETFGRPETSRFNWFLSRDRERAEEKLKDNNPFVRQMAQTSTDQLGF